VASGLVSFVFGVVLIYGFGFADGGLFSDAPTWEPVDSAVWGSAATHECAQVCFAARTG
jgi:hypothetical protein